MTYLNAAIIILNWNGWKDTLECLESLYQVDYPAFDVIIVDNDSKDDSIKKIREYCKGEINVKSKFFQYDPNNKPIKIFEYSEEEIKTAIKDVKDISEISSNRKLILIKNDSNHGFAGGNNIGTVYALNSLKSDYVMLLNNDTIVDKDFLKELVKVAESKSKIGFTGPKSYYYDFNGNSNVINFAGGKIYMEKGCTQSTGLDEIDEGQYNEIRTVDYVEGSCILAKKEILKEIGLLDPNYFAYWEETDLCTRGYKSGYTSVYVPKAKIWHKVSSSINNPTKIYYYTRNRFWFMRRYAPKRVYINFIIHFFGFHFWNTNFNYLRGGLKRKNLEYVNEFSKGVFDGLKTKLK